MEEVGKNGKRMGNEGEMVNSMQGLRGIANGGQREWKYGVIGGNKEEKRGIKCSSGALGGEPRCSIPAQPIPAPPGPIVAQPGRRTE